MFYITMLTKCDLGLDWNFSKSVIRRFPRPTFVPDAQRTYVFVHIEQDVVVRQLLDAATVALIGAIIERDVMSQPFHSVTKGNFANCRFLIVILQSCIGYTILCFEIALTSSRTNTRLRNQTHAQCTRPRKSATEVTCVRETLIIIFCIILMQYYTLFRYGRSYLCTNVHISN